MSAVLALAAALALGSAPAGACSAPRPGWLTPADGPLERIINRVEVFDGDGLRWNGVPVTRAVLRQYLDIVRTMEPMPVTILEPFQGVDCAYLETVRDDIEAALPCADRACGEGVGDWTEPEPVPPEPVPLETVSDELRAAAAEAARAAEEAARLAEEAAEEEERAAEEAGDKPQGHR